MTNRRASASDQWTLAGLLAVGALLVGFELDLHLLGFAFMLLMTLTVLYLAHAKPVGAACSKVDG